MSEFANAMAKTAKSTPDKETAASAAETPAAATNPKGKPKSDSAPKEAAEAMGKSAPTAAATPPAEAKPAEGAPPVEPTKKKGKQPGKAPPLGKKGKAARATLANQMKKNGVATSVKQAVGMLKQAKRAKFDETIEVHMHLGIDPKQSDQMVRGAVPLPHGIGKSVRVLVFAQAENAAKAKEAGADHVGAAELAEKIQKENFLDFDVALATADMMGVVGRLGKVLGPRGLMPSPKAGTVIQGDVAAAVREFKAGKVEFRADAGGNVHAPVGKMSFTDEKLVDNINTFIEAVRAAKPAAAKGHYVKSITLSATMCPGIRLAI